MWSEYYNLETCITAQKIKFSIKGFFSKCDQIRSFLPIRSHLLKKSLMENIIFCAVYISAVKRIQIRTYNIPYIPLFSLHTEIYSLMLYIQSE